MLFRAWKMPYSDYTGYWLPSTMRMDTLSIQWIGLLRVKDISAIFYFSMWISDCNGELRQKWFYWSPNRPRMSLWFFCAKPPAQQPPSHGIGRVVLNVFIGSFSSGNGVFREINNGFYHAYGSEKKQSPPKMRWSDSRPVYRIIGV